MNRTAEGSSTLLAIVGRLLGAGRARRVLLASSFLSVLAVKLWFALQYRVLVWDSYVYLLNAKVFLLGPGPNLYFEQLRPPLLPYLTAVIWSLTGASTAIAELIGPVLTVAAGVILYKLGAEMFNPTVGVFASFIFLLAPVAFLWTNQILTHGMLSFFVVLAVYCLSRTAGSPRFYAPAGVSIALASLARYSGLLMLPIATVFVMALIVVSQRRKERAPTKRERKWMFYGVVLFLVVWLPWLMWNYTSANSDPFASVLSGFSVASGTGPQQPWYYYLSTLPSIISIPGMALLVLGLASKRMFSDRKFSLVLIWLLAFLVFYSSFPNKQPRFYVDWLPPMALIMGIGFDFLLGFFDRKTSLRTLVLVMTFIWLANLSITSFQTSYQDSSFNRDFFESRGFFMATNWMQQQMNTTDVGAADYAPHFSYYTHRYFFSLASLIHTAGLRGISLGHYLEELKVRYVIATNEFFRENQIEKQAALEIVTSIGDFSIYRVGLSS